MFQARAVAPNEKLDADANAQDEPSNDDEHQSFHCSVVTFRSIGEPTIGTIRNVSPFAQALVSRIF